jgi:hypothetical protein
MRKIVGLASLGAVLILAATGGYAQGKASKSGGDIVIVFKDGHRKSFRLADIARVEFAGSSAATADASPVNPSAPPRGHFLGKWEVGDGAGNKFYITLKENGDAWRSLGDERGKWAYVNGEARVTWNDGAQDAIRKTGTRDQKFAYRSGKSFTDEPDNVTEARNTSPKPI